jgi:hypothetical protein
VITAGHLDPAGGSGLSTTTRTLSGTDLIYPDLSTDLWTVSSARGLVERTPAVLPLKRQTDKRSRHLSFIVAYENSGL